MTESPRKPPHNWAGIDLTPEIERVYFQMSAQEKGKELAAMIREMPPTDPSRNPTQKARKQCAEWLVKCLTFGWEKRDLDVLEALWWNYHDDKGEFISEVTNARQ